MTDTAPDAAFFILEHEPSLWSLPWVARANVAPAEGGPAGEKLVRLWFRRDANPAVVASEPRSVPDRPHDLEAYNEGFAPPTAFWHAHPRLEAYEVEYDEEDSVNWLARLWLKQA